MMSHGTRPGAPIISVMLPAACLAPCEVPAGFISGIGASSDTTFVCGGAVDCDRAGEGTASSVMARVQRMIWDVRIVCLMFDDVVSVCRNQPQVRGSTVRLGEDGRDDKGVSVTRRSSSGREIDRRREGLLLFRTCAGFGRSLRRRLPWHWHARCHGHSTPSLTQAYERFRGQTLSIQTARTATISPIRIGASHWCSGPKSAYTGWCITYLAVSFTFLVASV